MAEEAETSVEKLSQALSGVEEPAAATPQKKGLLDRVEEVYKLATEGAGNTTDGVITEMKEGLDTPLDAAGTAAGAVASNYIAGTLISLVPVKQRGAVAGFMKAFAAGTLLPQFGKFFRELFSAALNMADEYFHLSERFPGPMATLRGLGTEKTAANAAPATTGASAVPPDNGPSRVLPLPVTTSFNGASADSGLAEQYNFKGHQGLTAAFSNKTGADSMITGGLMKTLFESPAAAPSGKASRLEQQDVRPS